VTTTTVTIPVPVLGAPRRPSMTLRQPETLQTHEQSVMANKITETLQTHEQSVTTNKITGRYKQCYVGFEVLAAVVTKVAIFRDTAPCSLCVNRQSGGTYDCHLQGRSRWLAVLRP
jgi:hypothetical protein